MWVTPQWPFREPLAARLSRPGRPRPKIRSSHPAGRVRRGGRARGVRGSATARGPGRLHYEARDPWQAPRPGGRAPVSLARTAGPLPTPDGPHTTPARVTDPDTTPRPIPLYPLVTSFPPTLPPLRSRWSRRTGPTPVSTVAYPCYLLTSYTSSAVHEVTAVHPPDSTVSDEAVEPDAEDEPVTGLREVG